MRSRGNISDRPHTGPVLENRFTTRIQNASEDIGIDNGATTGVIHHSTQNEATGSHRPGEIRLTAGILDTTGIQADVDQLQVRCPGRKTRTQE